MTTQISMYVNEEVNPIMVESFKLLVRADRLSNNRARADHLVAIH